MARHRRRARLLDGLNSTISTIIPFPGTVSAIGETFPAAALAAGIEEAALLGVTRAQVDTLLRHDRPIAVYHLCHLGDADMQLRRYGAVGLGRLLASIERPCR